MSITMPYHIRPWSEKDLSHVNDIELLAQPFPWSADIFQQLFQRYHGWVIDHQQKVLGFIVVSLEANEVHILNVCVHPEYQRQGYGEKLLLQAFHYAVTHRAEKIYLEVRCSNLAAIQLYQKLGFHKIGERKNYYTDGLHHEDAIVFVKHCL